MSQNPIEQLVNGYFRRGQRVQTLRPNRLLDPTAVVVVLENGREYPHGIDDDQREKLPEWLMQATTYLDTKRAAL